MKKPDWMFQLACMAMVGVSLIVSDDVIAQSVGDRVVATANVYTKILNKQVGKVFGGEIDTVTDINGKWCALSRTKGWLPMQYVMTLDSGEKYYSERIKKNRNDFDAWAIRGMIRFENDRLRDALEDLNQSIVLRKTNPVTFNNRGIILHAMGRNQDALTNVDQAIKLNPNYADAHENRGLFLVSLGQYPEAMKSFDQAIKLRKGSPYAYINRGTARSNAGDYKGAKADFLQALSMERDLSDAYVGLSIVYLAEENLDKASKFAAEALKKNARSGLAFNERGWVNYKLGRVDEAIFDFNQAIRYNPRLSIAYSNRGICHTEKGDYLQALKDLNRAIRLNPNSAVAYTNRGAAYMASGKYQQAVADLQKAVKMAPGLSDASNALAWFLATCPEEQLRNGADARKHAEKACELAQWNEWSYLDTLAAAEAESGNFEKAIEHQSKALELVPDSDRAACEERLQLYRENRPFRSEFGKSASQ